MMATTEIEKVPATIQSRSQVFELKTIGVKAIADQLRRIADAEGIQVDDAALMLVARAGDGSMRDAQSAFDQVIAFAGHDHRRRGRRDGARAWCGATCSWTSPMRWRARMPRRRSSWPATRSNPATTCGWSSASWRASPATCSSSDRRLARRTIRRLRADGERERLPALATQFSAEDLMRAFEVLTKAEVDIRASMQPRYHLEMALLRWIHLRKLVPLSNLIHGLDGAGACGVTHRAAGRATRRCPSRGSPAPMPASSGAPCRRGMRRRSELSRHAASRRGPLRPSPAPIDRPPTARRRASQPRARQPISDPAALKAAFLAEVQKAKKFFYGTVIAQAQRIDVEPDRIVIAFAPQHKAMRVQVDPVRADARGDCRRGWPAAASPSSRSRSRRRPRRRPKPSRATGQARTGSPSCGSRRSPTRACRRCSTCSGRRSRKWKSGKGFRFKVQGSGRFAITFAEPQHLNPEPLNLMNP